MRSDSKRDGIKREQVIFTQACLHSRQRRTDYVCVSASAGQIWSWGGGGRRGRFEKMYVPLENSWLRPWFPTVLLPFVFLQLTFVFDHFLLDFQWCESFINMTIWGTPKNQTALCSQVHLTILISIFDSQKSLQVDRVKFQNNKFLRPTSPPFLLSYEVQCNWNIHLLGISSTYVL